MLKKLALLLATAIMLGRPAIAQTGYDEIVEILRLARQFKQPLLSKREMDFSAAAVASRRASIVVWQQQLKALDPSKWPVAQQVDYLLVRAELDQLDFEYRILRPWSRDPGLYVDIARDVAFTSLPLTEHTRQPFADRLAVIPELLTTARSTLTEAAGELAKLALFNLEHDDGVGHEQPGRSKPPAGILGWYDDLLERVAKHEPSLVETTKQARAAVRDFHAWLKQNLPGMTAPAGIGREHYDWLLRRVHFEPFTIREVISIGDREWNRSMAGLALERYRNRALPALEPAASAEEYQRRVDQADRKVRQFIRDKKFLAIPDYIAEMDNNVPWMVRSGGRNFWEEVQFRDPLPDKIHAGIPGHRFDLRVHREDKRPVRGVIEDGSRIEGWGFYLEEAMMNAGLLDDRPRTRELFWIFMAARAVRNRAEAMMHANQWTVDQAVDYMVRSVPYMDRNVARVDCEIYLRQPTYGQNYQMGKVQIDQLLAERSHDLGDRFDLGGFHDEFLKSGLIPVSLIRWEMTGRSDEIKQLVKE
ncbi:MAG: DUF885 family protein [Acidobacteriota bacterium]